MLGGYYYEKGISSNSILCSLLVDVSGGVASFAKSTDQTAKDTVPKQSLSS